jgi:hypothetical protein
VTLSTLPPDHPLRNLPLGQIKAEVRNVHKEDWRPITPAWSIAKNTFNELQGPWPECNEWRVS